MIFWHPTIILAINELLRTYPLMHNLDFSIFNIFAYCKSLLNPAKSILTLSSLTTPKVVLPKRDYCYFYPQRLTTLTLALTLPKLTHTRFMLKMPTFSGLGLYLPHFSSIL